MFKISVITPVYNGALLIHRVWESLKNQTLQNFEWIIIDDGSTDNLDKLINGYIEENIIDITFITNEINRGKHVSVNKGINRAEGEFIIIADCDDRFKDDSLEVFTHTWESIPAKDRHRFCGVRVCCEDQHGNRISDVLINDPLDITMSDAFYIHGLRKETWCMVLTDSHKKNPYPEDFKGSHYPEDIIWKKISETKKIRFINKSQRIYYINEGNSIMSVSDPTKVYNVRIERSLDILNNDMMYFRKAPFFFLRTILIFASYSIYKLSFLRNIQKVKNHWVAIGMLFTIPLGLVGALFLLSKTYKVKKAQ